MKFHFECWALCSIEIEEDLELDYRDVRAELCGFWATKPAAEEGRDRIENERLLDHTEESRKYAITHPSLARLAPVKFEPGRYIAVPLSQMEFDSLPDAEQMICEAAVLMFNGCGVQQ